MKINELAKLSGLNAETIRKYRERGLLKPARNPENGYYEYSWPDFLNLLYIRKLRGAHLSLDAIEATCRSGDAESLLQGYRETIANLEKQIRDLKRREMMLSITARHYERETRKIRMRSADAGSRTLTSSRWWCVSSRDTSKMPCFRRAFPFVSGSEPMKA